MGRPRTNHQQEFKDWALWCQKRGLPKSVEEFEGQLIIQAAVFARGNESLMARVLSISKPKLLRDMKRLGLALLLLLPPSFSDAGVNEIEGRWVLYIAPPQTEPKGSNIDSHKVWLKMTVAQSVFFDSLIREGAFDTPISRVTEGDTVIRYLWTSTVADSVAIFKKKYLDWKAYAEGIEEAVQYIYRGWFWGSLVSVPWYLQPPQKPEP